jgi:hypothetical protein
VIPCPSFSAMMFDQTLLGGGFYFTIYCLKKQNRKYF